MSARTLLANTAFRCQWGTRRYGCDHGDRRRYQCADHPSLGLLCEYDLERHRLAAHDDLRAPCSVCAGHVHVMPVIIAVSDRLIVGVTLCGPCRYEATADGPLAA